MRIIALIIMLLLLVHIAFAAKVVPLPDLLQPELVRVDENQMYITEGAKIYIYSLKDFHLIKKFGKRGEGPQEFMTGVGVVGVMWMEIQPDHIFIHTMGKISTFSKQGTFIKENKIKFPKYFPAMRFLNAADGKLYIMTYKTKEDNTQFLILTTKGTFLKKVFLPIKDMEVRYLYPFTIKNNKLYHLYDNETTEEWELHITPIE